MGKRSVEVTVTPRQRVILKRVTRSKKAAQPLVERCRVVLLSATGMHNEAQGDELGVDRQRVRRWRHRWARAMTSLLTAEAAGATDPDLEKLIISVYADPEKLRTHRGLRWMGPLLDRRAGADGITVPEGRGLTVLHPSLHMDARLAQHPA